MELNNNSTKICFPALNQLYYMNNTNLEYPQVFNKFISCLSIEEINNLENFQIMEDIIFKKLKDFFALLTSVDKSQLQWWYRYS